MSIYKVKSNLKHNGTEFKKGDEIDLDKEAAEVLLNDGIIVDTSEVDEDEEEVIQPPVNNVSRENDDVEGGKTVEPGKVEKPQPGDGQDDEEEDGKGEGEGEGKEEGKKEGVIGKIFGGKKDGEGDGNKDNL